MFKTVGFYLIFAAVFVGGCATSSRTRSPRAGLNSPAGMKEYLQSRRLPALEGVEIWDGDYGEGLIITTRHYEIYTTLLEPLMLNEMPGFMESAYRGYQSQLYRPVDSSVKSRVYLFAQRKSWEDFTRKFAPDQANILCQIKAGAYYLNGSCVAYNIGRERTFAVLGHEGWHQFNNRHFKYRLPSWLDEGIAMMFEASRYENGLSYFEPEKNLNRLGSLKITLAKGKMIPLRQLVAINPGEVVGSGSDDSVAAFYSQAYALVRFLREDDYGKRLMNYQQLLQGGLEGNWPLTQEAAKIASDRNIRLTVMWNRIVGSTLFELYFGNDFENLQKEYETFCKKIVYHVHFK